MAAARRELLEETGLVGMAWRGIGEHVHAYPDRHLHLFLFACNVEVSTTPIRDSHAEWVAPATLSSLTMPEANQVLIRVLLDAGEPQSV